MKTKGWKRIIVEKPLDIGLKTAKELNTGCKSIFMKSD